MCLALDLCFTSCVCLYVVHDYTEACIVCAHIEARAGCQVNSISLSYFLEVGPLTTLEAGLAGQ